MTTVNDTKLDRDKLLEQIASRLGVRAERGRRFAELTSLRVGGAIDWVVSPETEEQAGRAGRRGQEPRPEHGHAWRERQERESASRPNAARMTTLVRSGASDSDT